jgi:hypothetical protein
MKSTLRTGLVLLVVVGAGATACTSILGGFDFNGKPVGETGGAASTSSSATAGSGGKGSTSSTTTTSSTSTSSSSGSGGSGGSTPAGVCTSMGSATTILSAADLGSNQVGDILLLVPDPTGGPEAALHIVASNSGSGTVILRTLIDQGSGNLGPVVVFGAMSDGGMGNGAFSPITASIVPGGPLMVHGNLFQSYMGVSATLGDLAFPLDASEEVQPMPAPTLTSWPTPDPCVNMGYFSHEAFSTPVNGVISYAVACGSGSSAASLWIGDSQSATTPTMVASGQKNDLLMNPTAYAVLGGQSFVTYAGNNGAMSGAFAYGTSAVALAHTFPFALVAGQGGFSTGLVPLPANDGFALFMVSVTPSLNSGSLWSGPVHPADYAGLGSTPPPTLHQLPSPANVGDLAPLIPSATDADTIYGAASTVSKTSVDLTWTLRDGTPLVLNQLVYSSANAMCTASDSCNTILAAAAAPLGAATVVVWTEQTSDTPPVTTVKATKLLCSMMP